MAAKDKLIIALDFPRAEDALELADKTRHLAGFFKVGLELFTACGPSVVRDLKAGGAKIFLDLKCHDIPNTVAGAVRSAADLGVDMLTIHLGGGPEMVERAAEAAEGTGMTILGVTVLTSSDAETLRATGVQAAAVEDQVLRLARLGLEAGAGGIVASPKEITLLRQIFGDTFTLVTPGVRPAWAATDDQKRVLTPKEAVDSGANHLVIGRPVTAADDPVNALEKIIGEISA